MIRNSQNRGVEMESTQKSAIGSILGIRYNVFHCYTLLLVMALLTAATYLTGRDIGGGRPTIKDQEKSDKSQPRCDYFSGNWVFDNKSYPLYTEQNCSFIGDFACRVFGRKDSDYQFWRWQPHDCDLPRFNATELLEKLRGKRLVFVGDSVNMNQWVSLVCMVESSFSSLPHSVQYNGNIASYTATEYNASMEFYWSPLLVESNCDDPLRENHRIKDRIVRINSIEKHARHWTDADVLIFDSFTWWEKPNTTLLWGSFGSSDGIYKQVEKHRRYEMALQTWSDWLEIHLNRTKTKLFFMSLSPYHFQGNDWGAAADQNCYSETQPIQNESFWGSTSDLKMMRIVESAIDKLKTRGVGVQILNVTHLSDYRKDGHPSIYRKEFVNLTKEQLSNATSYADCVHWCLPGVPDVWNQILYAYLVS